MKLSRRRIIVIVALLVVGLVGLIGLQAMLLNRAFQSEKAAFARNVRSAMSSVVAKLESLETITAAVHVAAGDSLDARMAIMMIEEGIVESDSGQVLRIDSCVDIESRTYIMADGRGRKIDVFRYNDTSYADTIILDHGHPEPHRPPLDPRILKVMQNKFDYDDDSVTVEIVLDDSASTAYRHILTGDSSKIDYVSRVVQRLVSSEIAPIEARVRPALLDSLIQVSLDESDISQDYAFGVTSRNDDSLAIVEPAESADLVLASPYRTRLFSYDIFASGHDLVLHFPEQQRFVLMQVAPMIAASIIFTIAIIFCFAYSARIIVEQRRNAQLMVDFVNNMTHEFKTPISTVALAAEAIERPEVMSDKERVRQFTSMIVDENRRMRHQTEKILQMATLEEGDSQIKHDLIDVNRLVTEACDSFELQVKQRDGRLTRELGEGSLSVYGDGLHLANVLRNLLDNAVKYSAETPQVEVVTSTGGGSVTITVSDRGCGIDERERERVFDKYFRISSGNLHDVKGFGLGLSYVKLVVNSHGGSVSLEPRPGGGTIVTLTLPRAQQGSGQ